MADRANPYRGHRCPGEVVAHAVRLYRRFTRSFRDVEELLAERGIAVSYATVRRWVAKFGAQDAHELRRREVRAGRTWHLDEMAVRIGGRVHWRWRAVDEHGQTLDVRLQAHRDTAAAARSQRCLDAFSRVGNLCRPGRHRLPAAAYRATRRERIATWRDVAGLRAT